MSTPTTVTPDGVSNSKSNEPQQARRRRKSSNLGGEPRGDSGAPAFATTANRLNLRPASPTAIPPRGTRGRKRRKVKSFFRRWKSICLRHTWLMPLILSLTILGLFLINPTKSNPLHSWILLSYPLPTAAGQPTLYAKGANDFKFVAYYTIVLSFTREFCMQRIIRPWAVAAGLKSRAKQSRFMEQGYTAMYFGIFGPFGLYVMSRSSVWYFNTDGMYEGFPHKTLEAPFKAYYLLQASYWAQQMVVLVLMLEKPRKDFKELVAHHIITLALIWLSYRFHFTYMGVAIYITMDISDFFLATSKTINYLDLPFVGPYFLTFILIWTYLRHYINLVVIHSMLPLPVPALMTWLVKVFTNAFPSAAKYAVTHPSSLFATFLARIQQPTFPDWQAKFATVGDYTLNWDTQQYKCWISQWITFGLLAALQAVNIFWLFLILRIAFRYLTTGEERDERSEDEAEDEDLVTANTEAQADKPSLLLNGAPLSPNVGAEAEKAAASGADRRSSPRKRNGQGAQ